MNCLPRTGYGDSIAVTRTATPSVIRTWRFDPRTHVVGSLYCCSPMHLKCKTLCMMRKYTCITVRDPHNRDKGNNYLKYLNMSGNYILRIQQTNKTRHLKMNDYRGPQTAVSYLPFAVCSMPPLCIKNRVITMRGNMGNQPKQTWQLHEGKWNCYLFCLFLIPS